MTRRDVRVLLLYPPNQSWPGALCKPNGSLAYPSLAGALRDHGVEVAVFDGCVGNDADDLSSIFATSTELPSGLRRTGVTDDRLIEVSEGYDVIGITSIFTDQETMALHTARVLRAAYPNALLVSGGVNARARIDRFLDAGVDAVCLSEAERTLCEIVDVVARGSRDFRHVSGLASRYEGRTVVTPTLSADLFWDLDDLPIPAWDLLPNERYWRIGRPHGGYVPPGEELRYASMMTSMGCPFRCSFCHIAGEREESLSGPIGRYRTKSAERVQHELEVLRGLGVKQVYIEDDSLFGQKRRSIDLLHDIRGAGFDIVDVNGINIAHLLKRFAPDDEVLDALVEASFREIALPFESASARLIKKYASNKWDIERTDVVGLLTACQERGLRVEGNYMLGYPDETLEEIEATVELARRHMKAGLSAAGFFLVMPLPGTPLFDVAIRDGYLASDFDPDRMNWMKATMVNTSVPPERLEEIRSQAWQEINGRDFKDYKSMMVVA